MNLSVERIGLLLAAGFVFFIGIGSIVSGFYPRGLMPKLGPHKKGRKYKYGESKPLDPPVGDSPFVCRDCEQGNHPLIDSNQASGQRLFMGIAKQLLNILLEIVASFYFRLFSYLELCWGWCVKVFALPVGYFGKWIHNRDELLTPNEGTQRPGTPIASTEKKSPKPGSLE